MYKTNIIFIVSFILLITSSLLFFNWYFVDKQNFVNKEKKYNDNKYFQSKSQRMVAKYSSEAPALISLYNTKNDPHEKFISAGQCLICHKMGAEINRNNLNVRIKAPEVNYKCKVARGNNNCLSCHQNEK